MCLPDKCTVWLALVHSCSCQQKVGTRRQKQNCGRGERIRAITTREKSHPKSAGLKDAVSHR